MYLKQIEMQGFKSFPDRTRLVFEPGATVIIGPNGSGKSNISDAMRWVLGEISSKSLRGTKMEDIIFGGADSRKPMGYAEVSVTFDNTPENGHLDCPYDEVTVTRRYYRSGDSEYFINRKAVRLRDIYELFMNTGIGRDGYSIIGQGRIAEIISRKSDERRGIFEDAAGIAKYRHRKTEAERKLEATQLNMERAQDIIDEIGGRLGTLERECLKAKRFVEYSEIKKRADVQLWLFDTEKLRADIARAESDYKHAEFEHAEASEALETLETQSERLNELAIANKAESERLLVTIRERTRENYELDSLIKVTKNEMTHTEASAASDLKEAETLTAAAAAENAASDAKLASAGELAKQVEELAAAETAGRAAVADAEKRAATAEDIVGQTFGDISAARAELSDVRARSELLGRSNDEEQGRDNAARHDIGERERISALHRAEMHDSECKIAEYDAKIVTLTAELNKKRFDADAMRKEQTELGESVSQYTVKCGALSAQIESLKRLEEHFEGYNNSVRHVMLAYRGGRVIGRNGSPCGRIYGPLSSLIHVDSRYVTAIETAMGAGIQNIAVEDEATAHAAIECLKKDGAGRATFYPLTSVRAGSAPSREMRDAASCRGYIGIASELVDCDARFSAIISSMLGRIVVFDTLENATEMAKSVKYAVRTVTLDGQQINRDGSFTGGSVRTSSGILTRADDIKRLSAELAAAKTAHDEAAGRLNKLAAVIDDADTDIAHVEENLKAFGTIRAVEDMKLVKQREALASDEELLAKFRADLESVAGEKEKRESEIQSLNVRARELEALITELTAYRADKELERVEILTARDAQNAENLKLTVRVSELRRDIEGCNAIAALSREKAASLLRDAEARRRRAGDAADELSRLREKTDSALAEYTAGEEELARMNDKRNASSAGGLELERKLTDLRRVIRDRQARRDELSQKKMRCESTLDTLRSQMDAISSKFWEDFEMTRAEAVSLGYPAITAAERPDVLATQTEYRNKIRNIGTVNVSAIEEYESEKSRYDTLVSQMNDLVSARTELEKVIEKLETEMKRAFVDSFNQINENFGQTFKELFGGGSAQLVLTDPEHVLESGIEIKVSPLGKIIKSLMQLSGGEQAFVAIALFFAILQVNPTPFCILDEIEAALDEVNVERFAEYIKRYATGTQFILITHRRGTMNAADRLYGVTMPEYGISKVLSVSVDDIVGKKGGIWDGLS